MKAIKHGADLIFECDDGKTVRYNLNTGECIGKNGKPCMYLNSQLKGYSVGEIANSFEDKNFGKFINHVAWCCRKGSTEIQNIGTVFQRMDGFKREEQIYSAGLTLSGTGNEYFKGTINEIPKGLVKILREINVGVNNKNIKEYKIHTDAFNYAFNHKFVSLSKKDIYCILMYYTSAWDNITHTYKYRSKFFDICEKYGYTTKSLLNYLDYLATYEAISVGEYPAKILGEIADNCNMLSQMSNKYDKYPRHFLTSHQITSRTYQRWKQEFNEELFAKRVNTKMEVTIGDYKFIYPKSTKDIKDEAVQQSNCVAGYIDRVISGQCDIILMRKKNDIENSLVTVEIRDNKVVQARQRFNELVNESQKKALDKYEIFLSELQKR